MILILSIEKDLITSNVIDWLHYFNAEFIRINEEDLIKSEIRLNNNNLSIILKKDKELNLTNYNSYWYRRGNFTLETNRLNGNNKTIWEINKHNSINIDSIKSYLHSHLNTIKKSINGYFDNDLNKLTELTVAKSIGIKIPDTIITTSKESALKFVTLHEKIISKTIKHPLNLEIENVNFYWHTLLLSKKQIDEFPEQFAPIKLQNYIEKAFELRVFYIEGTFYASAIFSQNDEKTKIDFRNYNTSNPNRVIPYNLPNSIQNKYRKLMKLLKLNTGSLDIIVNKTGDYIFLEVNPIGQFTQVSYPCNYYLEKQMALALIKN